MGLFRGPSWDGLVTKWPEIGSVSKTDILLIDKQCTLCSWAARFIIRNGGGDKYNFLSIYSDESKTLLAANGLSPEYDQSLVLIENGRVFIKSSAVLRVARQLGRPYPALYMFKVVPQPIRDAVYDFIARHRHKI